MGATNSQGIYVYDANDQVSPIHTLLNLQATALTNRVNQVFTTCTSTSRPVAPYSNQLIRETDTGTIRFWRSTDSKWVSIPYRSGNYTNYAPEVTGSQTAAFTLNRFVVPSTVTYPTIWNIYGAVGGTISTTGRWALELGTDPGTYTDTTAPASSMAADWVAGNGTAAAVAGMTVGFNSNPNASYYAPGATIRLFMLPTTGSFNVSNLYGASISLNWTEVSEAV